MPTNLLTILRTATVTKQRQFCGCVCALELQNAERRRASASLASPFEGDDRGHSAER
jgi:hypothetical protein